MLFMVEALDKLGILETRLSKRPEHLYSLKELRRAH